MATDSNPIPPLFLSYATADRQRALEIADALKAAGINVWIDRRGIPGGTDWASQIAQAVRSCRAVAVLCSNASVISRNVRQELQLAWDHDKPILPLLLEPVEFSDAVAYFLQGRQWIEVDGRSDAEWLTDVARALGGSPAQLAGPAQSMTASPPLGNLPTPPTPLVGREAEVEGVVALLAHDDVRLVTLTGPGGVGKTRLAIAAAEQLAPSFPDGVWFVRLAPLRDPGLVVPTIANTLGIRDEGALPQTDRLQTFLRTKRLLLVIDNVEHVIEAAPELAEVLTHGSGVKLVATSRAVLRLTGETEFLVDPLSIPDQNGQQTLAEAGAIASVRLFVQRAAGTKPGFALTEENASAIAAICVRLDGLPLAIEIAAARVKLIPPPALLDRLEHRLPLLTGGARDLPARQQTLRDAIAWSYDLLSPHEQMLFQRLGVFVGGCTIEAAEAVTDSDGTVGILDGLASLADNSLLRLDETGDEPRFRMLETIREFALERLVQNGNQAAVREAHAQYFLMLARRAAIEVHGVAMLHWLTRIHVEYTNYRAALDHLTSTGQLTAELEMSWSLGVYWYHRGSLREGIDQLRSALGHAADGSPLAASHACAWLGFLAISTGDHDLALMAGQDSLRFAELAGDTIVQAQALYVLSLAEGWSGEDLSRGTELAGKSVALLGESSQRAWFHGHVLGDLGAMQMLSGETERGVRFIEEAVAIHQEEGLAWGAGLKLTELGLAAQRVGEIALAANRYGDGLRSIWDVRDPVNIHLAVTGLAGLAVDRGRAEAAARLLGIVDTVEERTGATVHKPWRPIREQATANARSALGHAEFNAQFAAGRSLAIEDAVVEALAVADQLAVEP